MKISGFTYVRNGINYQYPFLASIQSLLPIVDEMIVVVGDSTDGTRDAILALNDEKIKIVDSIWDEDSRKNGKIFAHQSNLGIEQITGDWAIHIQADEVLHENDIEQILNFINLADKMPEVDGLLFPFLHFWGDYKHIRNTRKTHGYEIRAFKNTGHVFSFHDSQGFRKYTSYDSYKNGETGKKMKVINTEIGRAHV